MPSEGLSISDGIFDGKRREGFSLPINNRKRRNSNRRVGFSPLKK
ncbi:hypothetical protein EGO73_11470 [Neisseria gonorrhoeae]|nr:hypothetical protein A6J45_010130 [Neisseria gonorrhoeae]QDM61167.1 hypothetical protein FNL98_04125 [Neisseria gonorrhoeae]QDM63854.1 hypothetical protein FNL99_07140 [Neisseria gonorrhoeae]ROU54933.1 hypothetical protein EGO73_11470 [Neisseria gonorrhoeae]